MDVMHSIIGPEEAALFAFSPFFQNLINMHTQAQEARRQLEMDEMQGQLDLERANRHIAELQRKLDLVCNLSTQFAQEAVQACGDYIKDMERGYGNMRLEFGEASAIAKENLSLVDALTSEREANRNLEASNRGISMRAAFYEKAAQAMASKQNSAVAALQMRVAIDDAHLRAHAAIIKIERSVMHRDGSLSELDRAIQLLEGPSTVREVSYWAAFSKAAFKNGLTKEQITEIVPFTACSSNIPEVQDNPQPRMIDDFKPDNAVNTYVPKGAASATSVAADAKVIRVTELDDEEDFDEPLMNVDRRKLGAL